MAFPTILVNSASGQDFYSGAGPATPVSGSNASFSVATVTLDGSPDLSGVATDGSHVLYMQTSTGVRFFKITAKNAGAFTVDVTPNPAGTSTGRSWAIGGKRATIGATFSLYLFDNAGGAGDAMPGWTVEMESGHSEVIAASHIFRRAGDATSGPITLRGTLGASVKPLLTFSNNGICLYLGAYNQLRDFELRNTNATKTASEAVRSIGATGVSCRGLTINHATNKFWRGIVPQAAMCIIDSCKIGNTVSYAIYASSGGSVSMQITYNEIYSIGADAINLGSDAFLGMVRGNLVHDITGIGIAVNPGNSNVVRIVLERNTVDTCSSDGIKFVGTNIGYEGLVIENNIISNNGGYGLNFATITALALNGYGVIVRNNDFYNNTSGKYNPADIVSENEQTANPQFVGGGDYSIGTNLKELAYPTAVIGS